MIFVTVGTHEQPFDRLIKEIDQLKEKNIINDSVFIQTGYSLYKPIHCEYKEMIGYDDMDEYAKKSQIIITHGGPGSIMLAMQYGKVPIVVPRQNCFGEHVDNHQVLFTERLEAKGKVIAVYDISSLEEVIKKYDTITKSKTIDNNFDFNRKSFIKKLENSIAELFR